MNAISNSSACTLVACPNPFDRASRVFASIPAGKTLAEMIGADASHSLAVEIDGHAVPRELWPHTRPKAGRTVHVTNYPQGGNAGKYARAALMIAIMIYAPYIAGYAQGLAWGTAATGIAGAALTAGIMVVGMLAVTPMIGEPLEVRA